MHSEWVGAYQRRFIYDSTNTETQLDPSPRIGTLGTSMADPTVGFTTTDDGGWHTRNEA